jgi:hypothetical protein
MSIKEQVISEISGLDESQLKQIVVFLAALKGKKKKPGASKTGKSEDPIFRLGRNPVKTGVTDASVNLDKYLY